MKLCSYIFTALAVLSVMSACVQTQEIEFGLTGDNFEIGPEGGVIRVGINSSDRWYATTESPWITVSPANGRGSINCKLAVDSTIYFQERDAIVYITNLDDASKNMELSVKQKGFPYIISLNNKEKKIDDFAMLEKRKFSVKVSSNVEYEVEIPDTSNWIRVSKESNFKPDRGARPRNSIITFEWDINTSDTLGRTAHVTFRSANTQQVLEIPAMLDVVQKPTPIIKPHTAEGDSVALISIARALGAAEWDTSTNMEYWNNVEVYPDGDLKGRVRSASFTMFRTKEGIPFAVQYLDAAEELFFYGNANTHLIDSVDCGEYITMLPNLKKLTIGGYGLTSLHNNFSNLKNLKYLNLEGNNFQKFPQVLTQENLPNLTALIFNSCTRFSIYDLSNDDRKNIGGFEEEQGIPMRLLTWNKLDTLRLSVNYLQGELPDLEDYGFPVWTYNELKDSLGVDMTELPEELVGLPKVLPDTDHFAINFNRFTGKVPRWLLYHPKLDIWYPFSLVFQQEGKTESGVKAGFSDEPPSLEYYYKLYKRKKYSTNKSK